MPCCKIPAQNGVYSETATDQARKKKFLEDGLTTIVEKIRATEQLGDKQS